MPTLIEDIFGLNQPQTTPLQDTLARLREGFIGRQEAGPPTRFGETSVSGGAFPATDPRAQFVSELLQPPTYRAGIQSALKMLEEQRLAEQSQRDLAAEQSQQQRIMAQRNKAFSGLDVSGRPAIAALIEGSKLPGKQGDEFAKQLAQELGGFTLSDTQTRYTPFGERIAGLEEDQIPAKEIRASESTLGARFKTDTRAFSDETDAMAKIRALGFNASPTAATDNSLIFQYARLQSPGIVTKDDFEEARKTGGLPASVVNFMNQMVDGKLPDNVRAQLIQAAALQYKGVSDIYDLREKGFRSLAKDRGLDPNKVVGSGRVKAKYEDLLNIDPRTNLLVTPPPPPGTVIRQVK